MHSVNTSFLYALYGSGSGVHTPQISQRRHEMEVSRQLHSPAALFLGNNTLYLYPVSRKLDRTHILSCLFPYLFIYLFIYFGEKSLPSASNRTTTRRSSNPWRSLYTEYAISGHTPQLILVLVLVVVLVVVVVPWCCLPFVHASF